MIYFVEVKIIDNGENHKGNDEYDRMGLDISYSMIAVSNPSLIAEVIMRVLF